jgi:hypothetical protein
VRNTIRNIKCFVSHTTVLVVGGVVIIEYIVQDAKTSVSFDDLQEQLSVICVGLSIVTNACDIS